MYHFIFFVIIIIFATALAETDYGQSSSPNISPYETSKSDASTSANDGSENSISDSFIRNDIDNENQEQMTSTTEGRSSSISPTSTDLTSSNPTEVSTNTTSDPDYGRSSTDVDIHSKSSPTLSPPNDTTRGTTEASTNFQITSSSLPPNSTNLISSNPTEVSANATSSRNPSSHRPNSKKTSTTSSPTSPPPNDPHDIILAVLGVLMALVFIGSLYVFYINKVIVLPTKRSAIGKFKYRSSSALASVAAEAKLKKISMVKFEEYYKDLNRDSGWQFSLQYEALRSFSFAYPTIEARKSENRLKNRWTDVVPFDHSIVKLYETSLEGTILNYINASYIPGYNSIRQYIATQGPLVSTLNDFWKMVWLENSPVIVMLAKCEEKMRTKCAQYWPIDGKGQAYGNLLVTLISETEHTDYVVRTLKLESAAFGMEEQESEENESLEVEAYPLVSMDTKKMEIKQFHFTAWPDRGCPKSALSLLNFIRVIHHSLPVPSQGPMIVHCSAGIGRTGTFIAIHHLMEMTNETGQVNIYETVDSMRRHRMNMVQTEEQYIFIHECLRELAKFEFS